MLNAKADKGRNTAPVFVLGCPHSGTTLLDDMLLSAGGLAVYLSESNAFNVLALHFGDLRVRSNRQNLLQAWLGSKLFRASGLGALQVEKKVLEECNTAADFPQIVMDEIVSMQGVRRWAEKSGESLLHLPLIKQLIPRLWSFISSAMGAPLRCLWRNYVMSARPVGGLPKPDGSRCVLGPVCTGTGVYWEWKVEHGRNYGGLLGLTAWSFTLRI